MIFGSKERKNMSGILMSAFLIGPFLFGIVSIIMGHKNYSKAKKMIGPNGKSFLAMQIVAVIHAISGYLIVGFYLFSTILGFVMKD